MSPRVADPAVRVTLIETAARVLASEGSAALTARRLAAEAGVTTMKVYTHFSGMDDVRRAIRREGFSRLAQRMSSVHRTDDPVADIAFCGVAYFSTAMADPHLYRVMFIDPVPGTEEDDLLALSTIEPLIDAVDRAMKAGVLDGVTDEDAAGLARQLWAVNHGTVTLIIAGLLDLPTGLEALSDAAHHILVGAGGHPAAIARSLAKARPRRPAGSD